MEFQKWLKGKFLNWQIELNDSKTQSQFASYLGVPPTSLSNWMTTGSKPRAEYIALLSSKLGPEIYEVLGMTRPNNPGDPWVEAQMRMLEQITDPDLREAAEKLINSVSEQQEKKNQRTNTSPSHAHS
jgi:transcriptional regulator with XRE-family HTH domain